jgi:hypothetical protein
MFDIIKDDPLWWILGALVTGFVAGWGAYAAILAVGAFEVVRKGSWVAKSDIVGNLLRVETLAELDKLIEIGTSMDTNKAGEVEVFMNRVHTFIHYLDIPKEYELAGDKFSFAERQVDYTIRDIPNLGGAKRPLPDKMARILGVLKGLRSSLLSKAGD